MFASILLFSGFGFSGAPAQAQCPEALGTFYAPVETFLTFPFQPAHLPFMLAGDFNGDNLDDVLVTAIENLDYDNEGFRMWVFLNDGAGGLVDSTAALLGDAVPSDYGEARQMFAEDFNGDGKDDIFISSHGLELGPPENWPLERNLLYLSNPGGTFDDASAQLAAYVRFSHGTSVGDLEGDGDPDIFDSSGGADGPLLLNDGLGNLTDVSNRLASYIQPQSLAIPACWSQFFDANGDGRDELLLLTNGNPEEPSKTLINDGAGQFPRAVLNPFPGNPWEPCYQNSAAADLDHDGFEDVVVHECENGFSAPCRLRALLGNGDGTFRNPPELGFPEHPPVDDDTNVWDKGFLLNGDLNGDGEPDVFASLTSPSGWKTLFFLNDGSGQFRHLPFAFSGDVCPFPELVIDLDGDGGSDLVTQCGDGGLGIRRAIAPYGPDITGDSLCNRIVGGNRNNTLEGGGGDDELLGGDGNDTLRGQAGNDRLAGEGDSDQLEGGDDVDTAVYFEPRRDYRLSIAGTGGTLTHRTTLAVDTLSSIEVLEFSDLTCPNLDTENDTDADGAPDNCDLCPGFDDTADADGDGIPDNCDICASGDDSVDSDEDGVPDACDPCFGNQASGDDDTDGTCNDVDACPGEDDSQDLDNDGVPDGCDQCPGHGDVDDDGDGIPSYCGDPCFGFDNVDDDGDGVCNDVDFCPGVDIGTPHENRIFCVFSSSFEPGH